MHVVLAILGSVITILFYLNRLNQAGIDLGWLNPFAWGRRRKWKQTYAADPLYSIESPMEATACLMYAMARSSGDISAEQKQRRKDLFCSEFNLSSAQATDLLSSCSYLMQNDEDKIVGNIGKFMNKSLSGFTDEQKSSAFELVQEVFGCEDVPSEKQKQFLSDVSDLFVAPQIQAKWA